TAADIDNGSNDACGIASLSVSPSGFDCSNLGENTVTLTVTDINNNPATCTATVTVEDNIDPVITCSADITMGTDQGLCGASVEFLVTATDNCDETTITCTIGGSGPSGDCAWNEVDLTLVFDNFPEETSWSIVDNNENVVASGGPYVNQPNGSILDLTFNLPDGEYLLVMNDSQGDGMCCDYGFGSYTLSSYGNLIVSGGIFGYSDKTNFCVETPPPGGNELLTVVESGDFFPVGTHLVTCTVFDGSENSDVCTFVITVNDTEAPMIDMPCPENITLCGAQNVFWTPPTATDNCAVVSTVSNYDPGDYFGVGTYTVTYTFFDEAGLSVSCSFMITINPVPDVVISQEDVPLWCQGIQVLTANVLNPDDLTYPLTFEWSDGLPGDPVVIAPANGEYTVTVTDALNCSTVVSTVVDEDISSLFSAYTIISGEEFEMYASDVLGGGVGIEDADEGEIGLNSNIYTFLKANLSNVMIDGSSFINEMIDADFDLPFPPFQGNSFNDLNNVVVPTNTTVTLSGTNYGWVTVHSGGTLIIDNATMYFQNLTTKKDATIIFNQPSDLMIKRRMTIGETNTINPDEHTCVIYVQDQASINQGSVVTANIYAPEGLDVNDSGASLTTYMTGIFISNDRIGSDHNVIWNWNLNCSYLPSASGAIPLAQSDGNDAVDDIQDGMVEKPAMGLNVYPNPASGIVNITVADLLGQDVELYMYDAFGKQVMRQPLGILEVGTISIDLSADRYTSGMYHVSLKAGEDWYNVRFILSK
ncbi:MAG: HYR domain-containing protein, partial [Bacteroidetes bacterium]